MPKDHPATQIHDSNADVFYLTSLAQTIAHRDGRHQVTLDDVAAADRDMGVARLYLAKRIQQGTYAHFATWMVPEWEQVQPKLVPPMTALEVANVLRKATGRPGRVERARKMAEAAGLNPDAVIDGEVALHAVAGALAKHLPGSDLEADSKSSQTRRRARETNKFIPLAKNQPRDPETGKLITNQASPKGESSKKSK